MVKLQRVIFHETSRESWTVIGEDFLPIEPIHLFLKYLENLERSPNTIKAYAQALKLYWEFLRVSYLEWDGIKAPDLADFMTWLRSPAPSGTISIVEQQAKRSEATVNLTLTAVCMFYDYQEQTGNVSHIPLYRSSVMPGRRYKGFLHHITKGKPTRARLLKLKVLRKIPKTIDTEQASQLVAACQNIRDKFLLCLLQETGMRIGQALGLRHEDIQSWDNLIKICPRKNNANGARSKSLEPLDLHVTKKLMTLYTEYVGELMDVLGDNLSDYVFVNLWDGKIGAPMSYSNVMDLFLRLKRKTGIAITPHMLRHSHATDLIREGMSMAYVQKRLGHASIQTTINTYVHVTNEDMKVEYQKYLDNRERTDESSTRKDRIDSQSPE
jgi:integrase/recombinase XerD